MATTDCVFCKIIAGEIPAAKVYEDQVVFAFLDISPISDGHTLVVPKQHFEGLHEMPAELLGQVASRLGKVSKAVLAATNADGYNVLCNTGRAAGQIVGHLHFHIIPRRSGDGVFNRWPAYKYPKGKIDELAARVRVAL